MSINAPPFDSIPITLRRELLPGEKLLWFGRPDPNKRLDWRDWSSMLGLVFGAGSLAFWEYKHVARNELAMNQVPNFVAEDPAFMFFRFWMLFVLSVPIVGILYKVLGFTPIRRWTRKRTYYAVTENRVMVLVNGWRKKTVQAVRIRNIQDIDQRFDATGVGTVAFCPPECPDWVPRRAARIIEVFKRHSGLDPFSDEKAVVFEDIPDAAKVYELVNRKRFAETNQKGSSLQGGA